MTNSKHYYNYQLAVSVSRNFGNLVGRKAVRAGSKDDFQKSFLLSEKNICNQ